MLSADIIKQIKRLQLKAGHLVTDTLAGEYVSAFKGVGMEFDRVREYVPGDDVRTIDWNVTARMRAPYVKVYREERELTLMLMVDVSPSQTFGTTGRFKNECSAELAAILAFLATKNNDKVGLIVFSDHVEHFIPPQKGRAHVWQIIRAVLTHEGRGQKTDIGIALKTLLQVCKRKSMCFLVSDFCADGYETPLRQAARRHNMICVEVKDPREAELTDSGFVHFQDAETGEHFVIDTSDPKMRTLFAAQSLKQSQNLRALTLKYNCEYFGISTADPIVQPLERFMRQRERRLNRARR